MSLCKSAKMKNSPGANSPAPDAGKCQGWVIGAYKSSQVKPIEHLLNSNKTNGESTSSSLLHSLFNNHRTLLPYRVYQEDLLLHILTESSKSNQFSLKHLHLLICRSIMLIH